MTGTPLVLNILLTILTDAAYALIVGVLLAGRWLAALQPSSTRLASVTQVSTEQATAVHADAPAQTAFPLRSQRDLLLLSALALIVAHLLRPWFLAASMTGSTGVYDNLAMVPTILSSTHQGTLWYANSAALVGLFFALTRRRPSLANSSSLACILLIAVIKSATGHAAGQGDFTLFELLQAVHIFGTAVWSGAILVSGLLVLPRLALSSGHAAVWTYTASLSRSATWAVLAVMASGIYTSDRELDNTLAGLTTGTWGKVLIVKVACVLLALTLGAITRFRYLQADASPTRANRLVRLVASEAGLMVAILCLSGVLGNHAPPMSGM